MKNSKPLPKVAIIGCGPRGLSALESIYRASKNRNTPIETIVFEESNYPGSGPVYNWDQPDTNWLNVSERAIAIPSRDEIILNEFVIPSFPDYQSWSGYSSKDLDESETDKFPKRSELGNYLNERYLSIAQILESNNLLTYVNKRVNNVDVNPEYVSVEVTGGETFKVEEAVLCIGHQPISLDDQLNNWKNRIPNLDNLEYFTQPYPVDRILESEFLNTNSVVAIRGFGLAFIDVIRALSIGRGGEFILNKDSESNLNYIESGNEPKMIVPFSLDGLPMSPKPINKKIDANYVPSEKQLEAYKESILQAFNSEESLESPQFLMDAIIPIIVSKYLGLGEDTYGDNFSDKEISDIIDQWLHDEEFEHELILDKNLAAEDLIQQFINMATGKGKVSLDFCIGHVWRHCQPTMYKLLSFAPISDELISEIVGLDERLKRYSYGPPVASLQQIVALSNANKLTLDYVANPEIELMEDGWHFTHENNSIVANFMVNSVLAAPTILKVQSSLAKNLIENDTVEPVYDKLGIRTEEDATITKAKKDKHLPIAVLGRLAKGTIIGVDAIAECFGQRDVNWAEGVVKRINYKN